MRRDVRKLTWPTVKFQEYSIEPLREIAWIYMVYDEHSSFGAVKNVGKRLGVNALLPLLCRIRFSKSFQSDNHVYCDLNNSILDFFYLVLSKSFLNSEIVLVVIITYDVIHQVDY